MFGLETNGRKTFVKNISKHFGAILTLQLLISLSTFAQRPNKDKIKALKIAHITEQLDLTEKEAQAFWPIYNANEEARQKLREASRGDKRIKLDGLTEAQAKEHLEARFKMDEERFKLQKEYYTKLLNILSAKKIIKLFEADHSFRRKMIDQFKQRHRGEKKSLRE